MEAKDSESKILITVIVVAYMIIASIVLINMLIAMQNRLN